jgi:hypothetical protein
MQMVIQIDILYGVDKKKSLIITCLALLNWWGWGEPISPLLSFIVLYYATEIKNSSQT